MDMFFIANAQLEGLIWLVVIVAWVVGQLVNAIKKSQSGEDRSPDHPRQREAPSQNEDPTSLQEFLESISNQQRQRTAPTPPAARERKKPKSIKPQPQYQKKSTKPKKSAPAKDRNDLTRRSGKSVANIDSTKSNMRKGLTSFKLPSMKLPKSTNLMTTGHKSKPPRIAFNLKNDETFKRGILYREVLGPPKALRNERSN